MKESNRATIADVARLSGVSTKTVSRVFSASETVSAVTRERVLAAAKQLRFRPNNLARSLRRGGVSSTVAFVMGDITNPFYFQLAAGIERELAESGLTMILATSDDSAEGEQVVVDALLAQRVRALILVPVADDQGYLEGERQLGTPIVCVDRPARNLLADSVVLENRVGMRDAVTALTDLGHRRVAFISNTGHLYTQAERLAGYRDALANVGVNDSRPWERSIAAGADLDSAVMDLLSMRLPPTAIVAGNNRGSTAAIRVLRDRRDDIAFIGFDDFELADALGISVVGHDTIAMGRTAARLIVERLADPSGFTRQVKAPVHLLKRGSGEVRPPADAD
ncbi:LacI family DNA-binding transcriptional regulator [Lacisediminihabitans changchengi]|uniref:LacI family DNA-binding transcriptional regulator n=1 Tax=Lacisediminihabitans changchengi TaxID=2787634 RepID=A0A934SN52_9MICO|nr:LacI family DNA-binding transcriptional regulator [Lacisediminihabitans changchengi]MBK4348461.1 LacI family DNA-binding transcriptional regulator [Lacisediminihabitans changchengi]